MGRPRIRADDERSFHFRMPRETWILLKKAAITRDCTMGEILVELVEKARRRLTIKIEEIGELDDLN